MMNSTIVGDNYTLYVSLPIFYDDAMGGFPLVVGLDGDIEFSRMRDIVVDGWGKGTMPAVVFVAIGYGSDEANNEKRNRDYTPTATVGIEDTETGGAENFYLFIRDELIPELESRYRIDSTKGKTLMGHSYGGLFTFYAMFQERASNPFNRFIPVATSFWYDSGSIFESEEAYAQTHTDFDARVYTTMGSLEGGVMLASFAEMNERLEGRAYPSLSFYHELLPKYGHSRSDYISYERGLAYVLNP